MRGTIPAHPDERQGRCQLMRPLPLWERARQCTPCSRIEMRHVAPAARSRRSFLKHLGAAAVIPLVGIGRRARAQGGALAQAAVRPRLHAMIVGINRYTGKVGVLGRAGTYTYRPIPGLRGCLNDARAIEA